MPTFVEMQKCWKRRDAAEEQEQIDLFEQLPQSLREDVNALLSFPWEDDVPLRGPIVFEVFLIRRAARRQGVDSVGIELNMSGASGGKRVDSVAFAFASNAVRGRHGVRESPLVLLVDEMLKSIATTYATEMLRP